MKLRMDLWTICRGRGEDFFGRRNRSFDSSLGWRPMKLFCKVLYIFALRLPDIGGASKSSDFYVLTYVVDFPGIGNGIAQFYCK